MLQKISSVSEKTILYIGLFVLGLLTATLAISYAFMGVHTFDVPVFLYSNAYLLGASILFFIVFYFLYPFLSKIEEKKLFLGIALVYFVIALHFIFNMPADLKIDALAVWYAAGQFKWGDFSYLTTPGSYLNGYPHQLGLVLFERLYLLFSDSPRFAYVINALFVVGINYFHVEIMRVLFQNRLMTNLTTILTFLFIPHFLFILFLYGSLPGLFFASLAIYCFVFYYHTKKRYYLPLIWVSISLASLIRNNYQIVAIALVLLSVIEFLRADQEIIKKRVLLPVGIIVSIFLGQLALNSYISSKIEQPIPKGIPKISYVVMGLQEMPNTLTRAGWYNYYTSNTWEEQGFDYEATKLQAKEDLQVRLSEFATNPVYAMDFFYRKIRNTWTEPLFSGVVSGTYEAVTPEHKGIWASLYRGEKPYVIAHYLAYIFLLFVYSMSLVAVVFMIKAAKHGLQFNRLSIYTLLVFLGGFAFHLVWESRSQYSHFYSYMLIPLAVQGFDRTRQLVTTIRLKKKEKKQDEKTV